jgi:hypothetical protein
LALTPIMDVDNSIEFNALRTQCSAPLFSRTASARRCSAVEVRRECSPVSCSLSRAMYPRLQLAWHIFDTNTLNTYRRNLRCARKTALGVEPPHMSPVTFSSRYVRCPLVGCAAAWIVRSAYSFVWYPIPMQPCSPLLGPRPCRPTLWSCPGTR